MNLGAYGKSKSPSMGATFDWDPRNPTETNFSSGSFATQGGSVWGGAKPTGPSAFAPSQMTSSVSLRTPAVGPANIMQPGSNRYQPPVDDGAFYGASEVIDPETKSKISTPVLILLSVGLIGMLAYATGIVGRATR